MLHYLTQDTCKGDGSVIGSRDLSPFLKRGVTLADVQSLGTVPFWRDLSKKIFSMGASSSLSSFRTTGLILSGPAAFRGLRFFNKFRIPAVESWISGITGVGFLKSSGRRSVSMTLLSTRSCTFIRDSSFKESGESGVNTD